jgi:hypothetical protein
MKKLSQRIEELRSDAEDCLLIGDLAIDDVKEEAFKERARRLLEIAAALEEHVTGKDRSEPVCPV